MKMLWNNFKVAFAMYSKIPMPRADWNKENMKYTFCFFPFIGLVIGALSYFAGWLGMSFYFNPTFISAILVLIPVSQRSCVAFENQYIPRKARFQYDKNIYRQIEPGTFAYIQTMCQWPGGRADRPQTSPQTPPAQWWPPYGRWPAPCHTVWRRNCSR